MLIYRYYTFLPERNDSLLNSYIPAITLAWNANTDISPYTNAKAVLNYIAKYTNKSEVKSDSYKDIFAKVITYCSATRLFLSAAVRMINIFITERD